MEHSYCAIDAGCPCATCKHETEEPWCCCDDRHLVLTCDSTCPDYEPEEKEDEDYLRGDGIPVRL